MHRKIRLVLAGTVIALGAACTEGAVDEGQSQQAVEKQILVAHFVSDCVGVGPQECLNVKATDDEAWTLWYGGIEGFEHEAGYEYRLAVRETTVEDPPADGSSIQWTLIEILEKTPVTESESGRNPVLRPWKLEAFSS